MGRVSKYPEEFRRQAASLVVDGGRGVRDVARELDINHETLRNWVGALRRERPRPVARSAAMSAPSWLGCAAGSRSWNSRKRS
ncbi:MAG: transposase [Actinomycetota bacterium]|nr:transposase [Actinomycetota bacterium]